MVMRLAACSIAGVISAAHPAVRADIESDMRSVSARRQVPIACAARRCCALQRQAMGGGSVAVPTVLGDVRFDAKGDIKDPRYDINEWHDGKYAAIAQ